jgi:hypothetical protein
VQPHSLIAFNTATESTNRIHDDAVARQLGFRGGLVPGVDVHAYLTHPPLAAWGQAWLERGTIATQLLLPVYDGNRTDVVPVGAGRLEVRDPDGQVCAVAEVALPAKAPVPPDPQVWPDVPQVEDRPPASPESLVPGTAFGLAPHGFHAALAGEYLDAIREPAALYREERVAHPGWILRDANYVLSANVRLGPWIHVESSVQHHGLVHDGDVVSARALVTGEWERKGHRFVTLDVLHLAGERPVARTTHTAIYRPRGT